VARRLRPEVVARLRGHLESGHRVILLSASPDLYVPAIGRSLGIDEVICTRVEKEDGVCRGQLDGANCKGDEKVAAVIRYLGQADSPAMSYAYGDSRHDLPILRWVRHGFLVKKGQLTRVEH
jgi:phosphatidylglycerophosphatase C